MLNLKCITLNHYYNLTSSVCSIICQSATVIDIIKAPALFHLEQFTVQNALKWAILTAYFKGGFNTEEEAVK